MPMACTTSALRRGGGARRAPRGAGAVANAVAQGRRADRRLGGLARQHIRQNRDRDEDRGATHGDPAEQRMEGEADEQVEWDPRQVEQGRGAAPRKEGADLVEIAQRLLPVTFGLALDRRGDLAPEDTLAQVLVDGGSDAGEDAAAEHV